MTELYFAYGSNMYEPRLKARCDSTEFVCRGVLDGYRFCYPLFAEMTGGGIAGLEPDDNSFVEGVIYKITSRELLELDRIERTHLQAYVRRRVTIRSDNNATMKVWTYVSNNSGKRYPPTDEYRNFILQGAKLHQLSEQYQSFLRKISGCPLDS